jgi:hypothetical protein
MPELTDADSTDTPVLGSPYVGRSVMSVRLSVALLLTAMKDRLPIALLLLAYAFVAVCAILLGERIPVKGGLGWDGEIYYFISKDFCELWRANMFDSYYIQRIVPSLAVKGMHWIAGTEHSYELTGTYFGIMNLTCMLGGTVLLLLSLYKVPIRWKWMAAMFALVSFCSLKHAFYYPVLTDSMAFVLGAAMLWAHVRGQRPVLFVTALVGAFTFPSIILMAVPLLVLRNDKEATYPVAMTDRWLLFLLVTVVCALAAFSPALQGGMPFGTMQPNIYVALVALLLILFYILVLWIDLGILSRLKASLGSIDRRGLLLTILILAAVTVAGQLTKPSPFNLLYFALHSVAYGLVHPGVSILAHVVYLGPMFLFLVIYWGRVKHFLGQLPLPLFWCVMFCFMLMVRSESRTLIAGWPFIIYTVVMALKDLPVSRWQQGTMLVIALLLSKAWWPINQGDMSGDFLAFPMQRYYMHIGPWMSHEGYLINLAVVLCGAVAMLAVMRPWRSLSDTSRKD